MKSRVVRAAACVGALGAVTAWSSAAGAVVPHRSETTLPSSNGLGSIAWNASTWRITQFLEHAYQNPTPTTSSRQFVYDSYPGVRIGTSGTWLSAALPTTIEYLPGTGIIHVVRAFSGYTFDEYDFQPMSLTENASVMLLAVTNNSATSPVDVYSIFNYYVGSAVSGSAMPGDDNESMTYDSSNGAYYLSGPSNVAFAFVPIGGAASTSYHGCTPNNPYTLLNSGSNLMDDTGSGGAVTNAVAGFQTSLGTPATGAKTTVGWITVLDPNAQGAAAATRVATWVNGRTAAQILSDEISGWAAWQTPAPSGADTEESALAAQSQAMLRMGQVTEAAPAGGQILASIAPGAWNITWVRDMAYSTVALVKSGHYAEAKAAIAFQLGATANGYQSYVGKPYQISVCRYFGNGVEQSDSNNDGPNIEFDGFGLFLWELDEYVKASGDTASLTTWWPTVKSMVADVLVSLQDPASGLIAADSSIWEVHWDGQQKHFAYTTITASNGLCSASRLAQAAGDTADVAAYLTAGQAARDAVLHSLRTANGTIGQSLEAVQSGTAYLDAAAIEAITLGLFDPTRGSAQATLSAIEGNLVPASGRGFFRDQSGSTYDSSEWVFVDLRMARALELAGQTTYQTGLFQWNQDQAQDNFGEFSELHDPVTANYTGQSPMVGFGAGAYLIALADRGTPATPTCGAFASEPALAMDAGSPLGDDGGSSGEEDGGSAPSKDAGADGTAPPASDAGAPSSDAGSGSGSSDATVGGDGGGPADEAEGGPGGGPGKVSGGAGSGGGCTCAITGADSEGGSLLFLAAAAFGMAARRRKTA
jgi:MYXO-CTERM domain-containing protein